MQLAKSVFFSDVFRRRRARLDAGALLKDTEEPPTLAEMQDTLRQQLRDPTLQLLYRLDDPPGYFDVDGRTVDVEDVRGDRAVTHVGPDRSPLAALVHDPAVLDESPLLESLVAALRLRLEKDRTVRALRISEYRSRALVEAIPDTIFRLSRDGIFLDVQAHDPENLIFPPEEMIGTSTYDVPPEIISREALDERRALVERAFETGKVQTQEYVVNAHFGRRFAEARIVPSGDDEFVMIVRDVTDRITQQRLIETQNQFLEAMGDATTGLLCNLHLDGRIGRDNVNLPMRALCGYEQYEVDGGYFWDVFVAPDDRADAERVVREVVAGGNPGEQQSRWLTKDGRELTVAWTCRPMPKVTGEEPKLLVSGTDVTERARREEEQSSLRRVAVTVASERRPEDVFETVTEEVGRVLGAHRAHMLRFEAESEEAVVVGVWDDEGTQVVGRRISVDRGPYRAIRDSSLPVRLEVDSDLPAVLRERLVAEGVTSVIIAPVLVSGRLWGAATVSVTEGSLPPDTEDRIGQFTNLVATALANAEAREELHASRARIVEAGDAERRRLERNLHDGAQQRLVSLSLSLRLAQAKLASDAHAADEILSGASVELALALEELRELARGIHPAVLTDRGLGPALESLADRTPIPVELAELPEQRLPPPVEAAAFYVVSEALANVTKYADATSVNVRIAQENGLAVVEVADDGVGGADPEGGSGLRGLGDRVAALEGRLAIVSPPGAGTRIRAEIPCGQ
jgi:PAS domain S-box-containing protein